VYADNIQVPDDRIVNKAGSGGQLFNHSMTWERLGMAALHVGTMQRVLDGCVSYARERQSGGSPLIKHQTIAHRISDMQAMLEACRSLVYRSAQMADASIDAIKQSSIAKLYVSEQLQTFMQQAVQLYGGYGYLADYGVEADLRDAVAATMYSGTSAVQRNIIAGYMVR
jgi:alkylation response protein AidB-like acyl-CoA dehydrogenase